MVHSQYASESNPFPSFFLLASQEDWHFQERHRPMGAERSIQHRRLGVHAKAGPRREQGQSERWCSGHWSSSWVSLVQRDPSPIPDLIFFIVVRVHASSMHWPFICSQINWAWRPFAMAVVERRPFSFKSCDTNQSTQSIRSFVRESAKQTPFVGEMQQEQSRPSRIYIIFLYNFENFSKMI